MSSSTKPSQQSSNKSLSEFIGEKARAGCPLCRLPKEVRSQLGKAATKRGFTRDDQLEWLRACYKVDVTAEQLAKHLSSNQHLRGEV